MRAYAEPINLRARLSSFALRLVQATAAYESFGPKGLTPAELNARLQRAS